MGDQKKSKFSEILEAISKFRFFEVKVENSIEKVEIGDKTFNLKDGFLILGDGSKIKLEKNDKGIPIFTKDGTEISVLSDKKAENVQALDVEKKVFSRADISEVQFEFLTVEKKHEKIIEQLKPMLHNYRNNQDMGALLSASTIIRLEDTKQKNRHMINQYMDNLHTCHKDVGRMIYNLFRSEILEKEILLDIKKFVDAYGAEEGKQKFLIQWYTILASGYPTAYFMQFNDSEADVSKELDWRFNRQVKYVDVYSRGHHRNRRTIECCKIYCSRKPTLKMTPPKPYKLGLSDAIKIRIDFKKV